MKKILFIIPYPYGHAPSQRFRFEQYFPILEEKGIKWKVRSFLDEKTWSILYKENNTLAKVFGIILGFVKRFFDLFRLPQYDYIFLHREATPLGPPWFEFVAAKIFGKKIIYDFDDAIWLENVSSSNKLFSKLKWFKKVNSIITWSYKISCGNDYLAKHSSQYNENVFVNPTTIDTEHCHNLRKNHRQGRLAIGWTGSHSTMGYVNSLLPVLKRLRSIIDFDFILISDKKPDIDFEALKFVQWSKEIEVKALRDVNIGIMPMPDDKWTMGKCGFKALQYMATGIPPVVSPVAVNRKIVDNGVNGYWAESDDEWFNALKLLLEDVDLREKMGSKALDTINNKYSVDSNKENYLSLFE